MNVNSVNILPSDTRTKARIVRSAPYVWQVIVPSHRVQSALGTDIVYKVASEHKTKAQARKALDSIAIAAIYAETFTA